MTKPIDHRAEAILAMHMAARDVGANLELQTGERKADILALGQLHATLALVEQQRIANLIALASDADERFGNYAGEAGGMGTLFSHGETPESNMRVRDDIAFALGIRNPS